MNQFTFGSEKVSIQTQTRASRRWACRHGGAKRVWRHGLRRFLCPEGTHLFFYWSFQCVWISLCFQSVKTMSSIQRRLPDNLHLLWAGILVLDARGWEELIVSTLITQHWGLGIDRFILADRSKSVRAEIASLQLAFYSLLQTKAAFPNRDVRYSALSFRRRRLNGFT